MKRQIVILLAATSAVAIFGAACSSTKTNTVTVTVTVTPTAPAPTPTQFVQVDRLARPAVNEGLIVSNNFLNAFNSIAPSQDISVGVPLVGAQAEAVLGATWEVGQVLSGHLGIPTGTLTATQTSDQALFIGNVVAEFLPDVMRVNTLANIPVGTQAYACALAAIDGCLAGPAGAETGIGMLTGGRKIEDPVMLDTLTVLTGELGHSGTGILVSDGVTYPGGTTNSAGVIVPNPQQGHHKLLGQTAPNTAAVFPFLAPPN